MTQHSRSIALIQATVNLILAGIILLLFALGLNSLPMFLTGVLLANLLVFSLLYIHNYVIGNNSPLRRP